MRRIACLFVPHFAAAAIVRAEPELTGRPLVVLSDSPPARTVIEVTDQARAQGIRPGMTEGQLLAEPRSVVSRERDAKQEVAAHRALLAIALAHSPRVEDGGPGLVYLDVAGLEGLFGGEEQIGRRLYQGAAACRLGARVGIAGSRVGARLAARGTRDVAVVLPGQEAIALAQAPLDFLDLAPETGDRLARWGLRTLGELAAHPSRELFERLGEEGLVLQRLARGEDLRPLHPWAPAPVLEEAHELDGAVDAVAPVQALLAALADRVCAGLDRRQQMADQFEWICRLADGAEHGARLVPAFPTRDARAVSALLCAALDAHPPRAPVAAVALRAWPVRVPPAQEPLDGPLRPSPRRLAQVLARLIAVVGSEGVGVPAVLDSHRADAVRLQPFAPLGSASPGGAPEDLHGVTRRKEVGMSAARGPVTNGAVRGNTSGSARPGRWALVLRRLRPPRRAAVTLVGGRPIHLRAEGCAGHVVASAGPWRSSGEWWGESRWARDEWDVELHDGTLCRVATDGRTWFLEGIYD